MIGGTIGKAIGGASFEATEAIASAAGVGGATGVGFALTFSYLYADGDVATDGWTDQAAGTSNIYQAIDEASASDADFVQSPAAVSDGDLKVRLYEGATQIVEWTHIGIADTFTDVEQTLTAPQYAAISSFANLFVEFDDNAGSVYRFRLADPPGDVIEPVTVSYRFKKAA